MAVTPTRVNQIAQSWQFQRCKWAGLVEAWYRFKRNIFRSPALSLRLFGVHVVAPAVSKRISAVLSPCERKGSLVLLVEIHLPGRAFAKCLLNFGLRPDRPAGIRHRQPMGDRQLRTVACDVTQRRSAL